MPYRESLRVQCSARGGSSRAAATNGSDGLRPLHKESKTCHADSPLIVRSWCSRCSCSPPLPHRQWPSSSRPRVAGGAGGPGGFGGGRMDPAQFRQMMNDRMKELMGANDEEWKALQPRIEKVQQLSRDASNFGGMGLLMDFGQGGGGRGRGFGGQGGPGGDRQPSAAQQKNTELVEVVKNKTSSPSSSRKSSPPPGPPGAGQGRAGQGPGGIARAAHGPPGGRPDGDRNA